MTRGEKRGHLSPSTPADSRNAAIRVSNRWGQRNSSGRFSATFPDPRTFTAWPHCRSDKMDGDTDRGRAERRMETLEVGCEGSEPRLIDGLCCRSRLLRIEEVERMFPRDKNIEPIDIEATCLRILSQPNVKKMVMLQIARSKDRFGSGCRTIVGLSVVNRIHEEGCIVAPAAGREGRFMETAPQSGTNDPALVRFSIGASSGRGDHPSNGMSQRARNGLHPPACRRPFGSASTGI